MNFHLMILHLMRFHPHDFSSYDFSSRLLILMVRKEERKLYSGSGLLGL